jgi:hypothetical protein
MTQRQSTAPVPAADVENAARQQIEAARQSLLRRIRPYLDELDDTD